MSEEITKDLWLHTCNRCGYEWASKNKDPKTCASVDCRSPYWNKKRVR